MKLKKIKLQKISPFENVETIKHSAMVTVEASAIEQPYKGYITQRIEAIYTEYNILKRLFDVARNR